MRMAELEQQAIRAKQAVEVVALGERESIGVGVVYWLIGAVESVAYILLQFVLVLRACARADQNRFKSSKKYGHLPRPARDSNVQ